MAFGGGVISSRVLGSLSRGPRGWHDVRATSVALGWGCSARGSSEGARSACAPHADHGGLQRGDQVVLYGLTNAPELNGRAGQILGWVQQKLRYAGESGAHRTRVACATPLLRVCTAKRLAVLAPLSWQWWSRAATCS